ncbi:MAG: hypothetical protein FJX75_16695 [Armatimonadetes bacterium]|nr:hypothetical protein [Armatimonadota bacterium]
MALRHLYTVLCEYVTMGRDDRPTAAGIFHNIEVESFPATRRLGLLVALGGDDGDTYRVTLDGPDGEPIGDLVAHATIGARGGHREHQQWVWTAAGVVRAAEFRTPGVYGISVWDDGGRVNTYRFGVLQRESGEGDDSE